MKSSGRFQTSDRPTVLALRALGLGDLLAGVPALRGLRGGFPEHRLVLATSPYLEPLVRQISEVDAMLKTPPLERLWVQMDSDDVAVNLHGRGPQSTQVLLQTEPSRLIGFAHPELPTTFGMPEWKRGEPERDRWCRLLTESGIDASPDDFRLEPPADIPIRDVTVIHPGAGARARHWPPDRWAVVARALGDLGHDVGLTGSIDERPLAMAIARQAGLDDDAVYAGDTDVAQLASIVAGARCLISSDTGPAHLGTAYGTPSVVLFGPTSPAEWGPPENPRHQVIWKGRRGAPNADAPEPGLLEITVDEVLAAVDRLPPFFGSQPSENEGRQPKKSGSDG